MRSMFQQVKKRKQPPAFRDSIMESCECALVFLFRYAFINENHRADIFFTVEKVKFLLKRASVCRAFQYLKYQAAEGKDAMFFEQGEC